MKSANNNQVMGMALGSIIAQKFPSLAMVAPLIAMKILDIVEDSHYDIFAYINIPFVIVVVIVGLMYMNSAWIISKYQTVENANYSCVTIIDPYDRELLTRYMKKYSEMFSEYPNFTIGDINLLYERHDYDGADMQILSAGQKITITDTEFDVSGFIKIEEIEKKEKENKSVKINITKIFVKKTSKLSAIGYFDSIVKRNKDDTAKTDNIILQYIKIMKKDEFLHGSGIGFFTKDIYKGSKTELNNAPDPMNEFFHPDKETMISRINRVITTKTGQFSAIFHGPGGTGKSSFAERLARKYKRNIVSIDLTALKSKHLVYTYFHKVIGLGIDITEENSIFLLEEFDSVISYLNKQNEVSSYMQHSYYTTKKEDIAGKKDDVTVKPFQSAGKFTIKDLLEIIQGPVPAKGRVIIATTNHLDKIIDECPALFRAGRLMPIPFDFLPVVEINKMIRYHFGDMELQDVTLDDLCVDFDPKISTSQILMYIEDAKDNNDPKIFIEKMRTCAAPPVERH